MKVIVERLGEDLGVIGNEVGSLVGCYGSRVWTLA